MNVVANITSNDGDIVVSPNLIRGARLTKITTALEQKKDNADHDEYYSALKLATTLMYLNETNVIYLSAFNTKEEGASIVRPFYTTTPAYEDHLWNFNRRMLEAVSDFSLIKYKEKNRNNDLFTCMSAEKIFQDTAYSEMYIVIEKYRDENGTPLSIKSLKVYYKHQLQKLFDVELNGGAYAVSV